VPICRIERAISSKRAVFRTDEVMVLEDPGSRSATPEPGAGLDRTYADLAWGWSRYGLAPGDVARRSHAA
jgi:hypothetical protein